jgi:hypothetical protein
MGQQNDRGRKKTRREKKKKGRRGGERRGERYFLSLGTVDYLFVKVYAESFTRLRTCCVEGERKRIVRFGA